MNPMTKNLKDSVCIDPETCLHLSVHNGKFFCHSPWKDIYLLCERNKINQIKEVHVEFCNGKEVHDNRLDNIEKRLRKLERPGK